MYCNPPDAYLSYQMQSYGHSAQDGQGANQMMRNWDNIGLTCEVHHYRIQQGQNMQRIHENQATIRKGKQMSWIFINDVQ